MTVSLTQPRLTWEESLEEGKGRSDWLVGMSVGIVLIILGGRETQVVAFSWAGPWTGQDCLRETKVRELSESKQT